ncbi:hypothetical protein [Domibacillus indicus]|uniref:hypothetical protein n=1 Tax=Domibacillus indicus TaxID=1437523 RepID=UPI000617BE31|nr:hypothetical protein [Domibacillus indicus]
MEVIFTIILLAALFAAFPLILHRRRRLGITGWKSWLTPLCFFSMGMVGLFASWFQMIGLYASLVQFALLLTGAYFTRYIPFEKKKNKPS